MAVQEPKVEEKLDVAENGQQDQEFLYKLRHSTAHVMAEAVLERFPEAKLGIGPPIENGFYYDFDLGTDENGNPRTFSPEDLEAIEQRMREIVKGRWPFERQEVSADQARKLFKDNPYKLELIDELEAGNVDEYGEPVEEPVPISIYRQHEFTDLCRGPHVPHTGYIKPNAFKLLYTAAAYWRGNEKNPTLQRIYGTAWKNKTQLQAYLAKLEEIEKRDHRRLGVQLDLFSTAPGEVGGGLILWHPKGGIIRTIIEDFARRQHLEGGYEIVYTPHIGRSRLWETSGHLDFYRENMYAPLDIEGQQYFLKPMNCPFHIMIYKSHRRSYRDLPMRLAEWGTVYRFERSGVLHGLLRVRGFTQDDAHIFCTPAQVEDEIKRVLDFSLDMLEAFGFEAFDIYVSTRPEKYVGDPAQWEVATEALKRAVDSRGLSYQIKEGEGAFYGPKIDIDVKDALGRAWQLTTIQFDFNLPERFDLRFVGEDGLEHQPYMVHRALLGSMERFFGVLIEHYGGAFPVWLSPVQAIMIPIADRHIPYCEEVAERLRAAGLRVDVDARSERMSAKIRDAQLQKIPYMLVVGDREMEAGSVAVRLRTEEDLGAMSVEDFLAMARSAIDEKRTI
ncbi:MAG: threonine--tRNA ligase [Chloroflexi bacterium]|nr:MAG: threonine--tRNA ligase [Chloroflexota bacterium]